MLPTAVEVERTFGEDGDLDKALQAVCAQSSSRMPTQLAAIASARHAFVDVM